MIKRKKAKKPGAVKRKPKAPAIPKLPKGITKADLKDSRWKPLTKAQEKKLSALGISRWEVDFDLWLSGGEWFIPTLTIASSRRHATRRTYAVGVSDKKTYRLGMGPHVTATFKVRTTPKNFARMLPYLELRQTGSENANKIRDRISSRRAQGQLFRAEGRSSWYW